MAEPVLLKDCKVYLGGYDLTGQLNAVSLPAGKASLGNGRFGDVCDVASHGLQQVSANLKGFWASGAGQPDTVIWPKIDPAQALSEWPLTLCPPQSPSAVAGAAGNLAYTLIGHQFRYKQGAQHGENLPFEFDTKPSSLNALYRGVVALPKALIASTTTGSGFQLGVLGASEQMVVVVHAFAIVGGSWVVTLESDDNPGFTTATTRATFAAITAAPNRAVSKLAGAIATDDYWRLVVTKTGGTSLTLAASMGIAKKV